MTRPERYTVGDLVAGRYLIEERIAEGGMAIVFRARHVGTGRGCALKLIRPELAANAELAQRFVSEARLAGQLGAHPHIVDVFDSSVDEREGAAGGGKIAVPFIAMEWLAGDTLAALVAAHGAVPVGLVTVLVRQLGDALDHAHHAGIVHRDLKSHNVFVTRDRAGEPCIKVLDFGIAKVLDSVPNATATSIGTPVYASPEQLGASIRRIAAERGVTLASAVSPATDVWALGLIAYEMLSGAPPGQYWGTRDIGDLVFRIAVEPRVAPSERARERGVSLPALFDAWFLRATAHAASARFASAGAAVEALCAALGASAEARAASPGPAATSSARPAFEPRPERSDERAPARTLAAAPATLASAEGLLRGPTGQAGPPADFLRGPTGQAGPPPSGRALRDPFFGTAAAATPAPRAGKAPNRRLVWALGGGAVVATAAAVITAVSLAGPSAARSAEPPAPAPTYGFTDDAPVPLSSKDPSVGERAAAATLVVFCDLGSESCARFVTSDLAALRARFGPTKLRIVWKHALPIPAAGATPDASASADASRAMLAAQAVFRLAGSSAFFKFLERVYAHQSSLGASSLAEWAEEVGIEGARFRDERDAALDQAKLTADLALGKRLGVESLPTLFLNCSYFDARSLTAGAPLPSASGTSASEVLAQAIEAELAAAPAPGTTAGSGDGALYAARCKTAWKTPEQRKAEALANASRLLAGDWEDPSTAYRTVTRIALRDGRPTAMAVWEREGTAETFELRSSSFEDGVLRWSYFVPSTGYVVSHEVLNATPAGIHTHWTNNFGGSGDADLTRTQTNGPPPPRPPPIDLALPQAPIDPLSSPY